MTGCRLRAARALSRRTPRRPYPRGSAGAMACGVGLRDDDAAQAVLFDIKTMNMNPSLAWKVSEKISLGAGINYHGGPVMSGAPDIHLIWYGNWAQSNGSGNAALYAADLANRADVLGVVQSQAQLEALIAREKSRGVAAKRIVLAGFSQGGAIALYTGLRHAERLAGIVALSTYLVMADRLAADAIAAGPAPEGAPLPEEPAPGEHLRHPVGDLAVRVAATPQLRLNGALKQGDHVLDHAVQFVRSVLALDQGGLAARHAGSALHLGELDN